ncbi:MAG: site-specific integrase, partial [Chloroflexota bacterium]
MNTRERIEPGIYRRYGRHYEVRVSVRGIQKTRNLPEGATLREARALRTKLQAEINQGGVIPPARLTVGQLLERWLEDVKATAKSRNTLTAYKLDVRYWLDMIGEHKVQQLSAGDVETARDKLVKGLSPKTVKNVLGTLKVALNWAVRHEISARNVAKDVKPPHVTRFESHWATSEEAGRLLAGFEVHGGPYGTMLALALLTCLRVESEWGAMRWRDVDLKAKTAALVRVRLQDGSIIPAGNSKHKRRLIALSDEAVHFLEIQRKWQARMRDANTGVWVDEEGLVFTTHFGERIRQSTLQRQFLKMQEEASVPRMRVHDLRHTGATLLLAAGVHVKVVCDMLGHSSVKMTLDTYGHAVPGLTEAAANVLGNLVRSHVTTDVTVK